jgi:PAS domain-containing protein
VVETMQALVKVVLFDVGLTLDTYHQVDRWTIAELQAYAQRLVTSIPSGLLVLSADLRVLFANRAFLEMVGASPDRVVGMPLEAFFLVSRGGTASPACWAPETRTRGSSSTWSPGRRRNTCRSRWRGSMRRTAGTTSRGPTGRGYCWCSTT